VAVRINEVRSEIYAFDATALLDDEVLQVITRRVAEELDRMRAAEAGRHRDTALTGRRRMED
jgi:hypothetical protein